MSSAGVSSPTSRNIPEFYGDWKPRVLRLLFDTAAFDVNLD
jgi:hypothetical protein